MALRYLHAFGFSAAVHRCCCEAKNPAPRLQCDTGELNSACTCRTSATERPETSSSFDGRSLNANHGPIRASVGLQLYLVMRGGIGFIWVLGNGECFPHTWYSDTHPRTWLRPHVESDSANCCSISLRACAWCRLIQSCRIVALSFLPQTEHNRC